MQRYNIFFIIRNHHPKSYVFLIHLSSKGRFF